MKFNFILTIFVVCDISSEVILKKNGRKYYKLSQVPALQSAWINRSSSQAEYNNRDEFLRDFFDDSYNQQFYEMTNNEYNIVRLCNSSNGEKQDSFESHLDKDKVKLNNRDVLNPLYLINRNGFTDGNCTLSNSPRKGQYNRLNCHPISMCKKNTKTINILVFDENKNLKNKFSVNISDNSKILIVPDSLYNSLKSVHLALNRTNCAEQSRNGSLAHQSSFINESVASLSLLDDNYNNPAVTRFAELNQNKYVGNSTVTSHPLMGVLSDNFPEYLSYKSTTCNKTAEMSEILMKDLKLKNLRKDLKKKTFTTQPFILESVSTGSDMSNKNNTDEYKILKKLLSIQSVPEGSNSAVNYTSLSNSERSVFENFTRQAVDKNNMSYVKVKMTTEDYVLYNYDISDRIEKKEGITRKNLFNTTKCDQKNNLKTDIFLFDVAKRVSLTTRSNKINSSNYLDKTSDEINFQLSKSTVKSHLEEVDYSKSDEDSIDLLVYGNSSGSVQNLKSSFTLFNVSTIEAAKKSSLEMANNFVLKSSNFSLTTSAYETGQADNTDLMYNLSHQMYNESSSVSGFSTCSNIDGLNAYKMHLLRPESTALYPLTVSDCETAGEIADRESKHSYRSTKSFFDTVNYNIITFNTVSLGRLTDNLQHYDKNTVHRINDIEVTPLTSGIKNHNLTVNEILFLTRSRKFNITSIRNEFSHDYDSYFTHTGGVSATATVEKLQIDGAVTDLPVIRLNKQQSHDSTSDTARYNLSERTRLFSVPRPTTVMYKRLSTKPFNGLEPISNALLYSLENAKEKFNRSTIAVHVPPVLVSTVVEHVETNVGNNLTGIDRSEQQTPKIDSNLPNAARNMYRSSSSAFNQHKTQTYAPVIRFVQSTSNNVQYSSANTGDKSKDSTTQLDTNSVNNVSGMRIDMTKNLTSVKINRQQDYYISVVADNFTEVPQNTQSYRESFDYQSTSPQIYRLLPITNRFSKTLSNLTHSFISADEKRYNSIVSVNSHRPLFTYLDVSTDNVIANGLQTDRDSDSRNSERPVYDTPNAVNFKNSSLNSPATTETYLKSTSWHTSDSVPNLLDRLTESFAIETSNNTTVLVNVAGSPTVFVSTATKPSSQNTTVNWVNLPTVMNLSTPVIKQTKHIPPHRSKFRDTDYYDEDDDDNITSNDYFVVKDGGLTISAYSLFTNSPNTTMDSLNGNTLVNNTLLMSPQNYRIDPGVKLDFRKKNRTERLVKVNCNSVFKDRSRSNFFKNNIKLNNTQVYKALQTATPFVETALHGTVEKNLPLNSDSIGFGDDFTTLYDFLIMDSISDTTSQVRYRFSPKFKHYNTTEQARVTNPSKKGTASASTLNITPLRKTFFNDSKRPDNRFMKLNNTKFYNISTKKIDNLLQHIEKANFLTRARLFSDRNRGNGNRTDTDMSKFINFITNNSEEYRLKDKCESNTTETKCICSLQDFMKTLDLQSKTHRYEMNTSDVFRNATCKDYKPIKNQFVITNGIRPRIITRNVLNITDTKVLDETHFLDYYKSNFTSAKGPRTVIVLKGHSIEMPCTLDESHRFPEPGDTTAYVWQFGDKTIVQDNDQLHIKPNGNLMIESAAAQYDKFVCKYSYTDPVTKHSQNTTTTYHIEVVLLPIMNVIYRVHYHSEAVCDDALLEMLELFLPQLIETEVCHYNNETDICYVMIKNSFCTSSKIEGGLTDFVLNYYTTLIPITTLLPNIDDNKCDYACLDMLNLNLFLHLNTSLSTTLAVKVVTSSFVGLVPNTSSVSILYSLGCNAGFGLRNQFCVLCDVGTYSQEGSAFCYACPRGAYQPNRGSGGCIPCPNPYVRGCRYLLLDRQSIAGTIWVGVILLIGFSLSIIYCVYNLLKEKGHSFRKELQSVLPFETMEIRRTYSPCQEIVSFERNLKRKYESSALKGSTKSISDEKEKKKTKTVNNRRVERQS